MEYCKSEIFFTFYFHTKLYPKIQAQARNTSVLSSVLASPHLVLAMMAISLVAGYLPARRASSVDPVESMRGD